MEQHQTIQFLAELLEITDYLHQLIKEYCELVTAEHDTHIAEYHKEERETLL